MELLRFMTAGSVDDGKSTLIGRLFHDYELLTDDQLESISRDGLNLAYVTDGLSEERKRGITIDVAYKFFESDRRKFIVADCPGHKEFTRNMVTAATTAELVFILVDVTRGIFEQTRCHSSIIKWMGKTGVYLLNKMDLVNYEESAYKKIVNELSSLSDFPVVPMSALHGDNVVSRSEKMKWYQGKTLHEWLHANFEKKKVSEDIVVSVQWADETTAMGPLISGVLTTESVLTAFPSGNKIKVNSVMNTGNALTLETEGSVKRGDVLIDFEPEKGLRWGIEWCQLLPSGRRLVLRHLTQEIAIQELNFKERLDVDTGKWKKENAPLEVNTIYRGEIFLASELIRISDGESAIFDLDSGETIAAAFVLKPC